MALIAPHLRIAGSQPLSRLDERDGTVPLPVWLGTGYEEARAIGSIRHRRTGKRFDATQRGFIRFESPDPHVLLVLRSNFQLVGGKRKRPESFRDLEIPFEARHFFSGKRKDAQSAAVAPARSASQV